MKDYDALHRKRINRYLKQVEAAYLQLINSVSEVAVKAYLRDELFKFKNNPHIKKGVDAAFTQYLKSLTDILLTGTAEEWKFAELKQNAIAAATIERLRPRLDATAYKNALKDLATQQHNQKALEVFQRRKAGKFTISERVWSISNKAKENIEMALDVALKEGISAQELSRSIKRNLNNPDALFRRVRDKHGNLKLSKTAQAYKPGQGVYRSAHKNALRLAANEINTAYRQSEQQRIEANNDVVGVRISLSPQHKIYDICDVLAGTYPKNFNWAGWHVGCKCYRTTILKSDSELISELNSGQNLPPETSRNFVKETPPQLQNWIRENEEKMKNWKSKPSFITDNKKYLT